MQIVYTKEAPEPIGPYSQAMQVGSLLFCSGQIPIDPKTGNVEMGSIERQTELVLNNVRAVLAKSGADLNQVVKTTVFLSDMAHFQAMNQVYSRYFETFGKGNKPARSTIAVKELPKSVSVEIEVIAELQT